MTDRGKTVDPPPTPVERGYNKTVYPLRWSGGIWGGITIGTNISYSILNQSYW